MPRIDNPLEKRLTDFAADKSPDNYVRLLTAFRYCCATFIFRLFDNHF